MPRKMCVIAFIAIIFSILAFTPHVLAASTYIPLDKSFYCMQSQVEVHLDKLEISDDRLGNTYSTTPLDRVKWIRLWYTYQNHASTVQQGYIQLELIDDQGNIWKPDEGAYAPENVMPNANTSLNYMEVGISKDSNIVKIRAVQGFNNVDFDVPQAATPTPTPELTATPTILPLSTEQPSSGGSGGCLPFLPFVILGGIGSAGIVYNKYGLKK